VALSDGSPGNRLPDFIFNHPFPDLCRNGFCCLLRHGTRIIMLNWFRHINFSVSVKFEDDMHSVIITCFVAVLREAHYSQLACHVELYVPFFCIKSPDTTNVNSNLMTLTFDFFYISRSCSVAFRGQLCVLI